MRATVSINAARCIGCHYCVVVCPEGVFTTRSQILAVATSPENCSLCLKCVGKTGCPERAITVKGDRKNQA